MLSELALGREIESQEGNIPLGHVITWVGYLWSANLIIK